MKQRKTITGDEYMLRYREHNGCPRCNTKLVERSRFHEDDEGYTCYSGRFLACPNYCRSANGTPYTISLPNPYGRVYEVDLGQKDFRNPVSSNAPAVIKRKKTGERIKLK